MERTVLADDYDGTIAADVRPRPIIVDDLVVGTPDLTEANREKLREELRATVERFVAQALVKVGPANEREAADARVAAKLSRPPQARSAAGPKKVGGKSHLSKKQRAEREQLNAIRQWARKRGYEVSNYGKIPERVMEAFQRLHGTPQQGLYLKAVTKTEDQVAASGLFSNASA